jgi:protein CMS1
MSRDDDLQEPLLERLSDSPEPKSTKAGKRKRGAAGDSTSKVEKKSDNQPKKQKIADDGDFDLSIGVNKAFSQMNSQLLSDYIAQRTRKYESDLSPIELEDRYIPGS